MIICLCSNVSEDQIKSLMNTHKLKTIEALQEQITVCKSCGCCELYIEEILQNIAANKLICHA